MENVVVFFFFSAQTVNPKQMVPSVETGGTGDSASFVPRTCQKDLGFFSRSNVFFFHDTDALLRLRQKQNKSW